MLILFTLTVVGSLVDAVCGLSSFAIVSESEVLGVGTVDESKLGVVPT